MNYTDVFLADLEREAPLSRRVLERFPDGKFDWKPAESSMPMGYLAMMVAMMPEWLGMVIQMNELDIAPKDGPKFTPPPMKTSADFVKALDGAVEKGRKALKGTNDDHLVNTNWKLLSGGKVLLDAPRHIHIRDGVLSHCAPTGPAHRYLRLLGAKPSTYGPPATRSRLRLAGAAPLSRMGAPQAAFSTRESETWCPLVDTLRRMRRRCESSCRSNRLWSRWLSGLAVVRDDNSAGHDLPAFFALKVRTRSPSVFVGAVSEVGSPVTVVVAVVFARPPWCSGLPGAGRRRNRDLDHVPAAS
jgi:hypothetical protein